MQRRVPPMSVATRSAESRRTPAFHSLAEGLADAERLVAAPHTRTPGNWPLDRLLAHLAVAINRSIDALSFRVPWYLRLLGSFIKGRVLRRGMPAGFRLPRE